MSKGQSFEESKAADTYYNDTPKWSIQRSCQLIIYIYI